jgi:hypothetical protein
MIRKDIKVHDGDEVTGTHDGRFLKYLKRQGYAVEQSPAENSYVMSLSYATFMKQYRWASAGAGKKGASKLVRRTTPTIVDDRADQARVAARLSLCVPPQVR